MNHATHCQFCQRPITLEIDDDYAKLADPYKLIPKRCCNACSDVRVARRVLEEKVSRLATSYASFHNPSESIRMLTRKNLEKLLQAYARMIARWHRVDGMLFDEAAVEAIMQKPNEWAEVLSRFWAMFRQWQRDQEQKALL